jgi:hypothetical protein
MRIRRRFDRVEDYAMKRFVGAALLVLLLAMFSLVLAGCGDDDDDNHTPADDDDNDQSPDDDDNDNDDNDDDSAPKLLAGVARVDITPTESVMMGGYGSFFLSEIFCRWSNGVHDPLYATALALDDSVSPPIIIVALDTVGILITDLEAMQTALAAEIGISPEHLLVSASHNHHGPDTMGLWGLIFPPKTGRDDEYIAQMIDGVVAAATAAYTARRPALAFAGSIEAPEYHFNDQADVDPDALLDSTLTVIAFTDPDGEPIGSIGSWGAHATAMGPHNKEISADFPGAYARHMNVEWGGVNLFVAGNLGGGVLPWNNTGQQGWFEDWGTWEEVDETGAGLAGKAQDALAAADPLPDGPIEFYHRVATTRLENPLFALFAMLGLVPRDFPSLGEVGESLLAAWRLGTFTYGTMPGEVAPNVGIPLRDVLGGDHQMTVNMGLDWIGYVVTPEQYHDLHYFYYASLSPGPECGNDLLNEYDELLNGR